MSAEPTGKADFEWPPGFFVTRVYQNDIAPLDDGMHRIAPDHHRIVASIQRWVDVLAQWVVERLLAERRISAKDVNHYLDDMQGEIRDIERRLAILQEAGLVVSPAPRSAPPVQKTRKRKGERRTKASGHPRGIAGTLAVLLRSIPAAEHAAIQAIRSEQGIRSAIRAARIAARSGRR